MNSEDFPTSEERLRKHPYLKEIITSQPKNKSETKIPQTETAKQQTIRIIEEEKRKTLEKKIELERIKTQERTKRRRSSGKSERAQITFGHSEEWYPKH